MSDIITIKSLKKEYRMGAECVKILKGIDLTIRKGECCCILGTSGSGKSTLLNMIAGLEKPTSGEIAIKGQHIEKMNEEQVTKFRQKHVGFVFQSYNLLTSLTAIENVAMPMIFAGTNKKKRIKEAAKMLDAVGLSERMDHLPSQMSGGQQQRVSIARAFMGAPEILFADEATGNLDTKTTIEVMELFVKMSHENDQTLIMVTHDVETAVYADRVIHMRDGIIERIDETKDAILEGLNMKQEA